MITTQQIRQLITPDEDISDATLTILVNAALLDIQRFYPDAPDDAYRDMQIIDWLKCALAYDGLASISHPGYSAGYEEAKAKIASRRMVSL